MESYVRVGGRRFEKSYICLHRGRGVKNCQNHVYVINEWPLKYKMHVHIYISRSSIGFSSLENYYAIGMNWCFPIFVSLFHALSSEDSHALFSLQIREPVQYKIALILVYGKYTLLKQLACRSLVMGGGKYTGVIAANEQLSKYLTTLSWYRPIPYTSRKSSQIGD